jgi:hypothetical protein
MRTFQQGWKQCQTKNINWLDIFTTNLARLANLLKEDIQKIGEDEEIEMRKMDAKDMLNEKCYEAEPLTDEDEVYLRDCERTKEEAKNL